VKSLVASCKGHETTDGSSSSSSGSSSSSSGSSTATLVAHQTKQKHSPNPGSDALHPTGMLPTPRRTALQGLLDSEQPLQVAQDSQNSSSCNSSGHEARHPVELVKHFNCDMQATTMQSRGRATMHSGQ
jgi:hypothetical protein